MREKVVLKNILKRVSRIAEFIAAMMLAAIFITFLLQIFSRYAPKIAWLMPITPIADWMMALSHRVDNQPDFSGSG